METETKEQKTEPKRDPERRFKTNPMNPGEKYVAPMNGGITPLPKAIMLARALAERFGVQKEGTEMEIYLLELARFCEAESGLPQIVQTLHDVADMDDRSHRLPRHRPGSAEHVLQLPIRGGGQLLLEVTAITKADLPALLKLIEAALENCASE